MSGRRPAPENEALAELLERNEASVKEPFVGIRTSGGVVPDLFSITSAGVSTDPIRERARAFLDLLDPSEVAVATFEVESDNWRRWSNVHRFLMRHGALLDDLSRAKRGAALDILRATLSATAYDVVTDVMRLNEVLRRLTDKPDEFGEWLYWMSIMGEPSATEPWGWQFDGHHLNINCFVLGDQVVMTPTFLGSEPTVVEGGERDGTRLFQGEEQLAIDLMNLLDDEQRATAVLADEIPRDISTLAFRDNFQLDYAGVCHDDLDDRQRQTLRDLIAVYVGRTRADHAAVRMAEIVAHLSETYFAWMGGYGNESVFYYRIHSPVVLIEFDHQPGVVFDNDEPSRNHVHTVVRTPNGNDYGKDLLREHYERFPHPHAGH